MTVLHHWKQIIVAKWFEPKGRAVIKGQGPGIFPGYLKNLTPT